MFFLPILIIFSTVLLSIPVGHYLAWIMDGRYHAPRWLRWLEERIHSGPQNWKQYTLSLLLFNAMMFVFTYLMLALQQPNQPLNPDGQRALAPSTVFNTAVSFLTNTNLQHYSGEQHLSYFSQLVPILWNMFVSATVGFCALVAIIRGLRGDPHMGNFYLDLWRGVVYIFLPFSIVMGLLLLPAGVPMTLDKAAEVSTLQEGAMTDTDGNPVALQKIARGPVAAIIPIKHLGTNGGGFFGANSAHPFENPGAWTNYLTCVNILLMPFSLVICFGRMLRKMRHAVVLYGVMMSLFLVVLGWAVYWDTMQPNPGLVHHDDAVHKLPDPSTPGGEKEIRIAGVAGLPVQQNLGNLEGKELRFGTSAGASYSAITTSVACGSVDCSHDSLNPLAGLTPFIGMWLNCIFGGKGVGLVNLLVYLIVGVFLAGLMVGRTPEYLGKKVEAREMKLAMLALLIHPIMILAPTGIAAAFDCGRKSTGNPGPHGFSEFLYEFSSASANNGSEFGGLQQTYGFFDNADHAPYAVFWDIATGLVMMFGRFIPIVAPIALAASLAKKKPTPFTAGTLRTDTVTFGFLVLGTILLVGALLFLPAAVLGPIAEHMGPMPFGS